MKPLAQIERTKVLLLLSWIYSIVHVYHVFSYHSSLSEPFCYFHILALVNNGEHWCAVISLRSWFQLFWINTQKWDCNSICNFFEETPYWLPQWLHHSECPVQCIYTLRVLHPHQHLLSSFLKNNSHPHRCEVIAHCDSHLPFPDGERCWASFHVPICCLHVCLGEMSIQTLCPFFNEDYFCSGEISSVLFWVLFCLCYWVVGANLISSYPWLCILLSWPLAWWWRLLTDLLVSTFVPFSLFSSHCPVQGGPVKT